MARPLRFVTAFPVMKTLLAVEVAAMAWAHLGKLTGAQRRRALTLLAQSRGRPGALSEAERRELVAIFAALEPRLFAGSVARRLSPLPVPKRVLYGPRGAPARKAVAERR
jgi:hypothetical protein